jgi:hypothetical protein
LLVELLLEAIKQIESRGGPQGAHGSGGEGTAAAASNDGDDKE